MGVGVDVSSGHRKSQQKFHLSLDYPSPFCSRLPTQQLGSDRSADHDIALHKGDDTFSVCRKHQEPFFESEAFQVLKANTFNQIHEIFSSCSFIDGQVQDMLPSTTSGRSHAPPFVYVKVLNCTGAFPCLKNRSAFFEEKQRQALQHGQSSKA